MEVAMGFARATKLTVVWNASKAKRHLAIYLRTLASNVQLVRLCS